MDIESYAYNKKTKRFVRIEGSFPREANFNPEAKEFVVTYAGEQDFRNPTAVAAKDLVAITTGAYVEVTVTVTDTDSGIIKEETLVCRVIEPRHNGVLTGIRGQQASAQHFHAWSAIIKPKAKRYKPPVHQVGDLVRFIRDPAFYAVVSKIENTDGAVLYEAVYFKKADYAARLRDGVNHDMGYLKLGATQIEKVNKPAPKVRMSATDKRRLRDTYKRNINSGNIQHNARFGSLYNRHTYKLRRGEYKHEGAMLGIVVAEAKVGIVDTLSDNTTTVLNALLRLDVSTMEALFTKYFNEVQEFSDYISICHSCGEVEITDELMYSDAGNTSFCRGCEGAFVYSELMDDYLPDDNAMPYFDSYNSYNDGNPNDHVTRSWAQGQNMYLYNGSAFDEETYCRVTEDDYDDEDEDNSSNDGLHGYHSASRNWKERWEDKAYVPLGLEIEVYTEQRAAAVMEMREEFPDLVYLERDGSLSDDYGFEVITQPLGKVEWALHGKKMLNILKANDCVAYNDPAGEGYGIHINISRKYLTALQEARMFMFLAATDNYNFVTAIAQRSKVYNADVDIGKTTKSRQKISALGGLTSSHTGKHDEFGNGIYTKKISGKGKYAPIKLHDDRLEIRIFQSTLNGTSFNKNIEFVWAMVEWTNTKTASGTSWMHTDFVKWLAGRANAERDFPNLLAFLRRDSYSLIDADDVENTWKALIPKETRRSVPQTVVALFETEEVEVPQSTALAVIPPTPVVAAETYAMAA